MHLRIPEGVNIIRVPCTGRVDVIHMVRAVEKGYDGVLALGCHEENCKFLRGNLLAHNRADMAQKLVREAGFDTKLIQFHGVAANQPHRFANILWTMHNELSKGTD
jgi:coenzyme F420-reducing hydrogenase delta subunit